MMKNKQNSANFPVLPSNDAATIAPKVYTATKQWTYEICEKVARSHAEARGLAFLITSWLEFLALNRFNFSSSFSTSNIQLHALLLLDIALETNEDLRKRCPTANLYKLTEGVFTKNEVYKLHEELKALNLPETVKIKPAVKDLDELLKKIPQTQQIRNVALILLDAYNLQFFSILAKKDKIAAACIAVARFWVLEKVNERWPDEYATKTKLEFNAFKASYNEIYQIAYMINQKNLDKKKATQKDADHKKEDEPSHEISTPPF